MKPKPVSHKADNDFKFESFSQRLSKVNVGSFHHFKRVSETSSEIKTHFAQTLEKWFDLNCTQDYDDLRQSIGNNITIQSLPQIVHRKDDLINILLEYLERTENRAQNVVLELISSLARDLESEFYPYFSKFFERLVPLLNTSDTESIENIFVCLTFLLKYLHKDIINEFSDNYNKFSILFTSRKDFIRKFASESFSFLVRKAKVKSDLINVLFESVIKNIDLVEGLAQILFETIKGVNNQFHSCAKSFLNLLFEKYLKTENDNLDEVIRLLFQLMTEYVNEDNCDIIWDLLLIEFGSNDIAIKKVVSHLELMISFKNCLLVKTPTKTIQHLMNYMNSHSLNEKQQNKVLSSVRWLLFYKFQKFSQKDIELINNSIYLSNSLSINQVFEFTKSVFNCVTFERNILPSLLNYCLQNIKSEEINSNEFFTSIKFLAHLLMTKRPPPLSGANIGLISKYSLKFTEDISHYLIKVLDESNNLQLIWCSIACLPHLLPMTDEKKLSHVIANTVLRLESTFNESFSENNWLSYILIESVIALIILKSSEMPINELSEDFFTDLIKNKRSSNEILLAFDLYLTYNKQFQNNGLNLKVLEIIYDCLEKNLSSFSKTKRLITLHILTLFDPPLPPSEEINGSKTTIFDICYSAESLSANLQEYREKTKHIQNLEQSFIHQSVPLTTSGGLSFQLMPVHYLLGALYENLSLLWQPIQKAIESYAKGHENKTCVLELLFSHLKQTTSEIYWCEKSDDNTYGSAINGLLHSSHHIPISNTKPDFSNHRILLLKTIDLFPQIVEPKNREFVNIFFNFIENEMSLQFIFGNNSRENIGIDVENDEQMEIDANPDNYNLDINKCAISRRVVWKTLFSYLSILSKFKNPKALYREPELLELYLNLLSSPDSEVQKHAFNCIITYNHSYLSLYSNNFLRLIDEKTFKSEINAFLIDSENDDNILHNEHRSYVVPLLMRVLYGKMISSNGTKKHGKNNSDFRRSLILKVLSAFNQNELILFMDFIFSPIIQFIGQDYQSVQQSIESHIKLDKFIPLRQFQALTITLDFILKHFGNNSKQITAYIFKVLVVASYLVTYALSETNRKSIKDYSISQLKSIRSNCFKVAKSFFKLFDHYSYSSIEIDSLFNSLIWSMLPNLDTESLASPSPLLSLFWLWSQNPRYFILLIKSHPSIKDLTPIDSIVKLYVNPKAHASVILNVTDIIENLLTFETFIPIDENDINIPAIMLSDINLSEMYSPESDINFGSYLLIPYVSQILNRIRSNFTESQVNNKSKNKKKLEFNLQELIILSRLSEFVTDSEECKSLIHLLIFSMNNKKMEEEKEIQTLKALTKLVQHLNQQHIEPVFQSFIPLFGVISHSISRTEMTNILRNLSLIDNELSFISQVITKINAYNPKFPEEPDYSARLDGFKSINSKIQLISNNELKVNLISIIMINCTHFIRMCDDMAIRESSSNTIRNVMTKIVESNNEELLIRFGIKFLLYTEIQNGLKNKSETVRHEFIELIIFMVRMFPHKHPILQQLSLLSDDKDDEIDFWLNIKHIQLHRRSRALSRLAKNEDLLNQFSNKIFALFLIPLTSSFLIDIQYAKSTSLINASIEALGAFCKHVQWAKYHSVLKYYIKQLIERKGEIKLNIKIISSVLDNFSFNTFLQNKQNESNEDKDNSLIEHSVREISGSTMAKISDSFYQSLLPLLHQCLHQKSNVDFACDSLKNEFPEDEDIQKIPIALAIIKLLKVLNTNEDVLKSNLSSVFLRLCQFLQSRTQSIRESARNTLIKVIESLGPKYLKYAINEMRSTLAKGYQRHVYVYTAHAILSNLVSHLSPGDLDDSLDCLLQICDLELFGNLAEEKDVTQITTKWKEARKCKGYEIYQIIARFVSENCLTKIILPLKNVLQEAHSHKVVRKVSQSLSKIGQGLVVNKGLNEKSLMLFIYGVANDVIPEMQIKNDVMEKESNSKFVKTDSFLLSKTAFHRKERSVKISADSNAHVMVEFALNCLLAVMKQNRMQSSNEQHLSLLDPYIELLNKLIDSKDTKTITVSLQCLQLMFTKFSMLSAFNEYSPRILNTLFILLNKYSGIGINDPDNVQMMQLCFKIISLFINDKTHIKTSDEQMAVLLSYVDQDIHDDSRQATAFVLLKSILSRKYDSLILRQIMKKLIEMSITSENDYIRSNCLQLSNKYLTEYPHVYRSKKQINFYIRQLEYEKVTGRESALITLKSLVSNMDNDFLAQNIGLVFVPLSSRLVNESSSECKKLVSDLILKLLEKVNKKERDDIFNDMVIPWLKDEDILQKLLASHLCSLFINVEGKAFIQRISHCLPLIAQQLDPDRYQDLESSSEKSYDTLVYQHLNVFLNLMKLDNELTKKNRWTDEINRIFEFIQSNHLLHSHVWVRIISTKIYGQLFSQYSVEDLSNAINSQTTQTNKYLLNNTLEKLIQLISKFCLIFRDIYEVQALSEQLIKNFVYISRVMIRASDLDQNLNHLTMITNKLIFEVKYELKSNPNMTLKRLSVFKWMAAVAVDLGSEKLAEYLPKFLPYLCREDINSTQDSINEENEVHVLTKQVLQLIKNIVGSEHFAKFYSETKNKLTLKKIERKKNRAIEVVSDVVRSTKRKIEKHNKSSALKKRKISGYRRT